VGLEEQFLVLFRLFKLEVAVVEPLVCVEEGEGVDMQASLLCWVKILDISVLVSGQGSKCRILSQWCSACLC
jgi:hypothetical protein